MTRTRRLPFRKIDLILVFIALLLGGFSAMSADRWLDGMEKGRAEAQKSKEELVHSAGLFKLHHAVYSRVGERAWESEVKPDFMRALTYAAISDSGNPFPESKDIVQWVREHPAQARELLEAAEKAHRSRTDSGADTLLR